MGILLIAIASGVLLFAAYRIYGSLLARLLRLDRNALTPAVEYRDGVDFEPIEPKFLLSQHFSAIAAAGPVVGPILAGVAFGWLPALLWILVGSIFIGGVHDIVSIAASIRHKARSIAEVVHQYMSRRSYLLFLAFIWIALVYIIVAFTDTVAASFVGQQTLENGDVVTGGGIATSSLLYLLLPVAMGLLLRFTKLSVNLATVIFLPLVVVAIWAGQHIPIDLVSLLGLEGDGANRAAGRAWCVLLLVYCLLAGAAPIWLLLQPRGHLGGLFLYIALAGGLVGILFGGFDLNYPAFRGWTSPDGNLAGQPLLPVLFITIACGACSGFHCLIASGTTSKQLRNEMDAKPIGYGAMMLEGMVAVVSLACVMMVTTEAAKGKPANLVYAQGLGNFLGVVGIPQKFAVSFGLLAFTTFVYDTLDVCTRLGRYIIQELTGIKGAAGRWLGTAVTAAVPLAFLFLPTQGNKPAWLVFWGLFGASNQLLAALALLGVTVWLWRTRKAAWVWFVTGLPAAFMYIMSLWALAFFVRGGFVATDGHYILPASPVPWAALVLIALAAFLLVEALAIFLKRQPPAAPELVGAAPA